jgi:hypothetical protein
VIASIPLVKPKLPQPHNWLWSNERILDPIICPSHAEIARDIVPESTVVECPPLPAAVVAGERGQDAAAAGVGALVGGDVEDDGVYD